MSKQNNQIDYHNVDNNGFRIGPGQGNDHMGYNMGINPNGNLKNMKNGNSGQSGYEEHKKQSKSSKNK